LKINKTIPFSVRLGDNLKNNIIKINGYSEKKDRKINEVN